MKFLINKEIFEKFGNIFIGVIVVKNINNKIKTNEIINQIRNGEKRIKEIGQEKILDLEEIKKWREIYRSFGSKPSDYRCSIESLYRSILKNRELRQINNLVDIYNLISIKYGLTAGGEDLDKVEGNIELTIANENEKSILILGETIEEKPYKGEVVYKDDNGAICRRWNWREADRTKLTEETKNCVLVIEGFDKKKVSESLNELDKLIKKYCSGETQVKILDGFNLDFDL